MKCLRKRERAEGEEGRDEKEDCLAARHSEGENREGLLRKQRCNDLCVRCGCAVFFNKYCVITAVYSETYVQW